MVGFHLFVRPALRRAMGVPDSRLMRPEVDATLENDVRSSGDRRNFQRALVRWADGEIRATTKPAQGSGVLSSMVGANGLVVVPAGASSLPAGSRVRVQMIGDLG
jgi:molybdopterin molybdotransferase